MPGGWPALLAVAPLLGPAGWVRFGVAPPGRDAVVFDPVDCALRVAHVDLDGGAEHHDLQVGRVWQDGAWGFVGVEGMAAADVGLLRIGDADAWIEVRGGGDELRGTNQPGDALSLPMQMVAKSCLTEKTKMRTYPTWKDQKEGFTRGFSPTYRIFLK